MKRFPKMISPGMAVFALALLGIMSPSMANMLGKTDMPITDNELNAIRAATVCTPDCVFVDKVCGYTCVFRMPSGTYCNEYNPCNWSRVIGWYGDQCETGFTNQYLCNGPQVLKEEACDNQNSSINCGGWSVCLLGYFSCINNECKCTGVGLCGGIPYVTQCGSHSNCM